MKWSVPVSISAKEKAAYEREAKRISDAIDFQLELERGELRRRKRDTRVVLLGESPWSQPAYMSSTVPCRPYRVWQEHSAQKFSAPLRTEGIRQRVGLLEGYHFSEHREDCQLYYRYDGRHNRGGQGAARIS